MDTCAYAGLGPEPQECTLPVEYEIELAEEWIASCRQHLEVLLPDDEASFAVTRIMARE
jgi:hypothetical protein